MAEGMLVGNMKSHRDEEGIKETLISKEVCSR